MDRAALTRTLTVLNNKGGVLKTTLVANVGHMLALNNYRTLLIDLDPQGNLAQDLGYESQSDHGSALLEALTPGSTTPLVPLESIRDNLDVLPGGHHLEELNRSLVTAGDEHLNALAAALTAVAGSYDFVIIDTPPQVPTLQTLALAAARWLIIPTRPDSSSRKGLEHVIGLFSAAQRLNPSLELLGVVVTGVGVQSRRVRRKVWDDLVTGFEGDDKILQTMIRTSEATAWETRELGLTVAEYESSSRSRRISSGGLAGEYQALTVDIVSRIADAESREV